MDKFVNIHLMNNEVVTVENQEYEEVAKALKNKKCRTIAINSRNGKCLIKTDKITMISFLSPPNTNEDSEDPKTEVDE